MLREMYPRKRMWPRLRKTLARRTWKAIQNRARGVGASKLYLWTPTEDAILRREWQCVGVRTLRAKLPGRTWKAIYQRSEDIGLSRGTPQGYVNLSAAFTRLGVTPHTGWRVIRWADVRVVHLYPGPHSTKLRGWRLAVEFDELRAALLRWERMETIADAARRYDVPFVRLREWVGDAIPRGSSKRHPPHRVDPSVFDRIVRRSAARVLRWSLELRHRPGRPGYRPLAQWRTGAEVSRAA